MTVIIIYYASKAAHINTQRKTNYRTNRHISCGFPNCSINDRILKYFITFTQKCFALAVAAIIAELRAILRIAEQNPQKKLQFLCCLVTFMCDKQFCTKF